MVVRAPQFQIAPNPSFIKAGNVFTLVYEYKNIFFFKLYIKSFLEYIGVIHSI